MLRRHRYALAFLTFLVVLLQGQAWEDMHTKDSEMIRQAFKQVRLGLPVDSSRDYKIKIKDFPDV
jgi:hypothetical protein